MQCSLARGPLRAAWLPPGMFSQIYGSIVALFFACLSRTVLLETRQVRRPQGYGMAPAVSSWGGDVLFDGASFHLYVAAMTNNCSLSSWETNSRIEHAVSQSVTGPYVRSDVAVNTWSHNPVAMQLPGIGSPRFALLHIGSGSGKRDGGANCSRGAPFDRGAPLGTTAGATIHVSDSLAGPWRALLNSTLGPCNNPSPWVHRNGTIFLVCSGGPSGNGLWRAERIWGPWSLVTATLSAPGGVFGVYEDPYLYMSGDTFHLLFHVYETGEPGTTCVHSTVSDSDSLSLWLSLALSGSLWLSLALSVQVSQARRARIAPSLLICSRWTATTGTLHRRSRTEPWCR